MRSDFVVDNGLVTLAYNVYSEFLEREKYFLEKKL